MPGRAGAGVELVAVRCVGRTQLRRVREMPGRTGALGDGRFEKLALSACKCQPVPLHLAVSR